MSVKGSGGDAVALPTPVGVTDMSRGSSEANTPGWRPPEWTCTPIGVRESAAHGRDVGLNGPVGHSTLMSGFEWPWSGNPHRRPAAGLSGTIIGPHRFQKSRVLAPLSRCSVRLGAGDRGWSLRSTPG